MCVCASVHQGGESFDVAATGLSALQRSLEGSISQVQSAVLGRQNDIEIGQIAQLASEQPAEDYAAPEYDGSLTSPESWDGTAHTTSTANGRDYHQILTGPYLLGSAIEMTDMPDWSGAGESLQMYLYCFRHNDSRSIPAT